MAKVANNLKYYREKLGVIQKELEWRTGIGFKNWPRYEAGAEPKLSTARSFVNAFNQIAKEKGIDIKKLTLDDLYPPDDL